MLLKRLSWQIGRVVGALEIEFEIPVAEMPSGPSGSLAFHQWLPMDAADDIRVSKGNLSARLYFKIESTWWASRPTVEELPRHFNVLAHRLWAEVRVDGLDDEFADYASRPDYTKRDQGMPAQHARRLDELADGAWTLAMGAYNRLIEYARAFKGQYQLETYPLRAGEARGHFTIFRARIRKPDGPWSGFRSGSQGVVRASMLEEKELIARGDWEFVKAWVQASTRPPLAGTLLAAAEHHASTGRQRSALIEAVAALEVAVQDFAKNPLRSALTEPARIEVRSLATYVDHLGFSTTATYLVPLLVPQTLISDAVVQGVTDAIETRNKLVHGAQRDVDDEKVRAFLRSIRAFYEGLRTVTEDKQRSLPLIPS